MTRALHILLALVVALPLGAGGLCCCLFAIGTADVARDSGAPACCSNASAPATSQAPCPAAEGADCECPSRDAALVEVPASGKLLSAPGSMLAMIAPPADAASLAGDVSRSHGSRIPHPPPKQPLYRTFSSIRC